MARKTDAYVDTSALIAFVDVSDTYHVLFRRLFAKPPKLITTSLVVTEGHAWFLKRYDRTRALQFIAMIEDMKCLKVASTGSAELKAGADLLRKFSDQDLTMVDAVGLHVLQERGCKSCWSTDFHLGLTGAPLAIHEH
ncbi:MAG: type II toxin-antitoxin system VapC family toxin [Gammaproteobacteria bacterium]